MLISLGIIKQENDSDAWQFWEAIINPKRNLLKGVHYANPAPSSQQCLY